jgi:porphobilinogen deaminase
MWQANLVAERLRAQRPALDVQVKAITTMGDKILHVPLTAFSSKVRGGAGSRCVRACARARPEGADARWQGVFTKELDVALLAGEIDIGVWRPLRQRAERRAEGEMS